MKSIIVKEVDRLYSKINKTKFISEYLIYLMEENVKVACFNVIGEKEKREQLIYLSFNFEPNEQSNICSIPKDKIQEITFEEFMVINK